jgi:hypothetical protein
MPNPDFFPSRIQQTIHQSSVVYKIEIPSRLTEQAQQKVVKYFTKFIDGLDYWVVKSRYFHSCLLLKERRRF